MDVGLKKTAAMPRAALWAALFIALSVIYFGLFHFWERNSDDANSLMAAFQIFRGNPLLRGWQMPTDTFYFTDLVLEGILTLFFGLSPKTLFMAPAIIWSAVVCFCMWFAGKLDDENPWAAAWVFICLGLPIVIDTHAMRLIGTAPMHISTVLMGAVIFRLMQLYWEGRPREKWHLLTAFAVAVMGTYSDPFIVFVSIGPAMVVCAWYWLESTKRGKCSVLIGTLGVSVLMGRGLAVVVSKIGGVQLAAQPIAFAKFEELPNNFALIARSLLMVFGADFTGRAVSISPSGSFIDYLAGTPVTMFVRLLFVVCAAAAVIFVLRRQSRLSGRADGSDGSSLVKMCLAASIVLSCTAAFVSNQMQNLESSRYLLPTLLYGSILGAVVFCKARIGKAFLVVAAILSTLSVTATMSIARDNPTYFGKNIDGLGSWLVANDLRNGYGPYWSASVVTLASSGSAKVRTIAKDQDGKIRPYLWLADRHWYAEATDRRFVLVDKANPGNYSTADVISQLGEPSEIKQYSIYDVLIYDAGSADLSPLTISR